LTGFRARWSLDDGLVEAIRFYAPQLLPDDVLTATRAR
jgi:hypothetical protein